MTTHCADATALDTALDTAPLNARSLDVRSMGAHTRSSADAENLGEKKSPRSQTSALNAGLLIGSAGLCALAVVAWLVMVF